MLCHRFHSKHPTKNRIKKNQKIRTQDILKSARAVSPAG